MQGHAFSDYRGLDAGGNKRLGPGACDGRSFAFPHRLYRNPVLLAAGLLSICAGLFAVPVSLDE